MCDAYKCNSEWFLFAEVSSPGILQDSGLMLSIYLTLQKSCI